MKAGPLLELSALSLPIHHMISSGPRPVAPFSHAVELIRFALYGQFNPLAFAVTLGCTLVFFGATVFMYDPAKGLWRGRTGGSP